MSHHLPCRAELPTHMGTNIGNAYLEAVTRERVYIIAGSEFGEREGHALIIHKALYGLCSSGLYWHEQLPIALEP